MKLAKPFLVLATILALSSCNKTNKTPEAVVSLKNAYAENFYIGAALDSNQIKETDTLVSFISTSGQL